MIVLYRWSTPQKHVSQCTCLKLNVFASFYTELYVMLLQTCDVDKHDLEDELPHTLWDKAEVQRRIRLCATTGEYPGWNLKWNTRTKEFNMDPSAKLKPVVDSEGNVINKTRLQEAETGLGLCISVQNSTWALPLFDCYIQVCINY
jgi:hypothetical protein